MSDSAPPQDPPTTSSWSPSDAAPSSRAKLRKIPQIPIRRSPKDDEYATQSDDDDDDEDEEEEGEDDVSDPDDADSPMLVASKLGLNHIRTRSAPSPLRFSSLSSKLSNLGNDSNGTKATVPNATKLAYSIQRATSIEQGTDRFDNGFQLIVKLFMENHFYSSVFYRIESWNC
jgi:hypothetical protein